MESRSDRSGHSARLSEEAAKARNGPLLVLLRHGGRSDCRSIGPEARSCRRRCCWPRWITRSTGNRESARRLTVDKTGDTRMAIVSQIRKTLSANDVGSTGAHQAGILIPKDPKILAFFPTLDASTKNPRISLY